MNRRTMHTYTSRVSVVKKLCPVIERDREVDTKRRYQDPERVSTVVGEVVDTTFRPTPPEIVVNG